MLLHLAAADFYQPRWTEQIQEEWSRNLLANRPELSPHLIQRARAFMERSFPNARVTGYEALEDRFPEVQPRDRHVAAAALRAEASHIVTRNLRDFPSGNLAKFGIQPIHPDAFISRILAAERKGSLALLEAHRRSLQKPPLSRGEYRAAFVRSGLPRSAEHIPDGIGRGRTTTD